MGLSEGELEQIMFASRLEPELEDTADHRRFFNRILELLSKLHDVDTTMVDAAGHVSAMRNVFREDKLQESMKREAALANAPEEEAGAFKVPRIV